MYKPVQKSVDSENNTDDPSANDNVTESNEIDCGGDAPTRANVKLMVMNAYGNTGMGNSDKRKNAIHDIIVMHQPDIVFFQEFKWKGITGTTWENYPIPESYQMYKSHDEACIMIDATHVVVRDVQASDIDSVLSELQRTSNNRLKKPFPTDFDPVPRMCLKRVEFTAKPALKFICVSWHGKYKHKNKKEAFEYLMEFFCIVKEKYEMAILIGGDFNIDMDSIQSLVHPPLNLCVYKAAERRTGKKTIDFFIASDELAVEDIQWLDLERYTTVDRPNEILDHDPVVATLTPCAEEDNSATYKNKNDVSESNSKGHVFDETAFEDTHRRSVNLDCDTIVVRQNAKLDHAPMLASLKSSLEEENTSAFVNQHAESETNSKDNVYELALEDIRWLYFDRDTTVDRPN